MYLWSLPGVSSRAPQLWHRDGVGGRFSALHMVRRGGAREDPAGVALAVLGLGIDNVMEIVGGSPGPVGVQQVVQCWVHAEKDFLETRRRLLLVLAAMLCLFVDGQELLERILPVILCWLLEKEPLEARKRLLLAMAVIRTILQLSKLGKSAALPASRLAVAESSRS